MSSTTRMKSFTFRPDVLETCMVVLPAVTSDVTEMAEPIDL